jgi:hypothetical protein
MAQVESLRAELASLCAALAELAQGNTAIAARP